MSTVRELEAKLSRISAQLNTLQEEKIFGSDTLDKTTIQEMIDLLKEQYFRVVDELEMIKKADYSDGELDLLINEHKGNGTNDVWYDIRLTNTPIYIGEIRVTYCNPIKFFGDIGYELKKEYRGNGYMLKALNVLKEPLRERGLIHPRFTVYPSNIPSVKTIEHFGGKKVDTTGFYDIYQVDIDSEDTEVKRVK